MMRQRNWMFGPLLALLACRGEPLAVDAVAAPTETVTILAETAAAGATAPPLDSAGPSGDVPDAALAIAPADGATTAAIATVRLLDAGIEPRRALRYGAVNGFEQVANLRMTTELEFGAAGQKMPTALPQTRMVIDAKVKAVSPSGETRLGLSIVEADLAEGASPGATPAGEKLALVIRGMKGLSGDKLVDARGVSHRFALVFPEGKDDLMATAALKPVVQGFERAIDQMTVPFPEEAVGVGAKWEVVQKVADAGMALDQTTTFEIVGKNGGVVSLRYTVTLAAPPGKLESAFAGGMAAEVLRLTGSGEGTIDTDLTKMLPAAMKGKSRIAMQLEIGAPGAKRTLEVEMRLALEATSP